MRGKLMFLGGLAAGFVLGSRAGREKYEEIRANAKKVWEHPPVQEAAGVAQAQANKLYTEGKDKLDQSKVGQKLHSAGESNDSLAGSNNSTGSTYCPAAEEKGPPPPPGRRVVREDRTTPRRTPRAPSRSGCSTIRMPRRTAGTRPSCAACRT